MEEFLLHYFSNQYLFFVFHTDEILLHKICPFVICGKKIIKISSEIVKFVYSQGKYEDDILLKREVEKIIIDYFKYFFLF